MKIMHIRTDSIHCVAVNTNWVLVLVLVLVLVFVEHLGLLVVRDGKIVGGFPCWELLELVYGGFGFFDEPIDGFAGTVVAEAVLNVVELNGSMS